MSLVRTYKFKGDNVEGYKFRMIDIPEDLYDLTDEKNKEDLPVVKLIDLIKHIDYTISHKELWDMIEKEEQSSEWMFLLDSETNRGFHINTTGKLREVKNIVLDDEGVWFFLEELRCEKSKNILLKAMQMREDIGIQVTIHGQEYTF